jgi:hypothetical protein
MKLKLFIICLSLLILTACAEPAQTPQIPAPQIQNDTEPEDKTPQEGEPSIEDDPPVEIEPELPDLRPLELLGYHVTEDGVIYTYGDWEICEPDVFREFMFGVWEGEVFMNWDDELQKQKEYLIIDDSEKGFSHNLRFANNYYRKGDTIIFYYSDYQTGVGISWLDMNNPNTMYWEWLYGGYNNIYRFPSYIEKEIRYLTKTDAPINEPENGYMSRLRLYELMTEYDIDFEMIFRIEHDVYVRGQYLLFIMNGGFCTFPIYLISEEPDKLVFESELMYGYGFAYMDVTYTIERINGEWVRTIEVDEEQFKERLNRLTEE